MATGLTAGQSYSLSSHTNDRISVVFVKLTDSSLRSIDDYLLAKNAKRMPTISFSGTIGAISIPQKDSETARTFDFTIHKPSSEEIHQCVFQTKNKLTSLGLFTKKLQIQGNDDIYQSTIKKMSQVDEENKKQRAKEIKTNGSSSAGRLRKVHKGSKNSQNLSGGRGRPQSSAAHVKQASVNAQPNLTPSSRAISLASIQNEKTSPFSSSANANSQNIVAPAVKDASSATTLPLRKLTSMCLSMMNTRTISPCPSNGSQGSPPGPKRPTEVDESGVMHKRPNNSSEVGPPPKKVRVAHNVKCDAPSPAAQAPSLQNGASSAANPLRQTGVTKTVADTSDAIVSSSNGTLEHGDEDFLREFTPIKSREQRHEYKACFDLEYSEHQLVYGRVSQKIDELLRLKDQLNKESSGTPRYETFQNEIFEEYHRIKNDAEYTADRSRYEHLLKKLEHIKKLVQDYDRSHRRSPRVSAENPSGTVAPLLPPPCGHPC